MSFLSLSTVLGAALVCIAPATAKSQDGFIPMQVRLAYAGESGMMVSWNTYSKLARPIVHYGRRPNQLTQVASSDVSVTYQTSLTYNNHVPLQGLDPDTVYYYLPQFSNATEPYSFKTSRSAGDQSPYSVAVAIDMGVMGPDGLTTRVGKGGGHPLKPGDNNTLQSLQAQGADTDFLWHRESLYRFDLLPILTNRSGRHRLRRLLAQGGDSGFPPQHHHCQWIEGVRVPSEPVLR